MKQLKTICSDVYGMEDSKEFVEFGKKYAKTMYDVAENFVNDCVEKNIEYCSAKGMFWSLAMAQLTTAYAKVHSKNTCKQS